MTARRRVSAGTTATGLLCASLLSATMGCESNGTVPQAQPAVPAKNLLLITVDTLRTDRLSACGHPGLLTPHLDALSRRGVLVPGAVTPANTTLPAHASLLTSLPPEGHGGLGNGMAIRRDLPTLARCCREGGMATAAMVSSWVLGTGWNLEQGFDEYLPLYRSERRRGSNPEIKLPLRARDTSRAACRWLRQNDGQPFMLWLHYMDPHQVYDPPPPFASPATEGVDRPRTPEQFLDLHRRREALAPAPAAAVRTDYNGEVCYTDRCIGDVLRTLRSLGLEENTLVVVAADHGEALSEKECYYGHTLSLAETVNRVPLILAGPGVVRGIRHRPATLLDVSPTILSLLGLPAVDDFQGRDLSPLLRQTPDSVNLPAPLLFTRGEDGRRAWLVDGMKADFDPEARITGLHDLERDPLEAHDLRETRPGLAEELSRRYMAPHHELAAMAAEKGSNPPHHPEEETTRKLKEMGYIEK